MVIDLVASIKLIFFLYIFIAANGKNIFSVVVHGLNASFGYVV